MKKGSKQQGGENRCAVSSYRRGTGWNLAIKPDFFTGGLNCADAVGGLEDAYDVIACLG